MLHVELQRREYGLLFVLSCNLSSDVTDMSCWHSLGLFGDAAFPYFYQVLALPVPSFPTQIPAFTKTSLSLPHAVTGAFRQVPPDPAIAIAAATSSMHKRPSLKMSFLYSATFAFLYIFICTTRLQALQKETRCYQISYG